MNHFDRMRALFLSPEVRATLTPTAFWLLGYYALRMNDDYEAWYTVNTIAAEARIDAKNLQKARSELVKARYLVALPMRPLKFGSRTVWVQPFRVVITPPVDAPPVNLTDPSNPRTVELGSDTPVKLTPTPPLISRGKEDREEDTKPRAKKNRGQPLPSLPDSLNTPAMIAAWAEWQEHRRQLRKPLTALAAKRVLDRLASWGPVRAAAAIDHSIGKGWQDVYEPNPESRPPTRSATDAPGGLDLAQLL